MKTMKIPAAAILPEMKDSLGPKLKREFKKQGLGVFRLVDAEWVEDGLILYYDDGAEAAHKAAEK